MFKTKKIFCSFTLVVLFGISHSCCDQESCEDLDDSLSVNPDLIILQYDDKYEIHGKFNHIDSAFRELKISEDSIYIILKCDRLGSIQFIQFSNPKDSLVELKLVDRGISGPGGEISIKRHSNLIGLIPYYWTDDSTGGQGPRIRDVKFQAIEMSDDGGIHNK